MRIYQGLYEAVKETERELVEMGIHLHPETMQDKDVRDNQEFETIELQGYGYKIVDSKDQDKDLERLGGNIDYATMEINERIDGGCRNPGRAWLQRKETWSPFIERNGKFSYTYNERLREQISRIIEELRRNPNTRQAVITIYDRHQDMSSLGGIRRVPCSMYYQFLMRTRNQVEVVDGIYTMRSCDFYTHYIYDVWLAMTLQQYIANSIGKDAGHFTHFIGSLHAYKRDYKGKGVF